jgi:hypothetical protein
MTTRRRVFLIIALVVIPLAIVATLDYVLPWQASLSFFYLIPMCSASFLARRRGAMACCFVAAAVLLCDQWRAPLDHRIALWNAAMRLGTLLVVGWLLPIATDDVKRRVLRIVMLRSELDI